MRIDIEGIIAAAVFLDREEEDLCRWELETETLSFGISEATPIDLTRRCEALAALQIHTGTLADVSASVREGIEARHEQGSHPDVRHAIDRQADKAEQLERRMTQLRRRIVDLVLDLGSTIRSLQGEDVDASLIRIFGNMAEPLTAGNMTRALASDRAQIDQARSAWRTLQGDRLVREGRAPCVESDVAQALCKLEKEGLAQRHPRTLRQARWTIIRRPSSKASGIPSSVVSLWDAGTTGDSTARLLKAA